jgi:hypothetical protein
VVRRRRARAARTPGGTGTSGATADGTAARRTTGGPSSPPWVPRGATTRPRASGTCTPSWPSSPTSTGTTPRSGRRCTGSCGSGSAAASTGCGSTPSTRSPRTRSCATTRPPRAATTRTGRPSTSACAGSAGVADEFEDRMLVGEVALKDLHRAVSYLESGDQLHLAHNFVFAELRGTPRRSAPHRRLRGAGRADRVAAVVPGEPRPPARGEPASTRTRPAAAGTAPPGRAPQR